MSLTLHPHLKRGLDYEQLYTSSDDADGEPLPNSLDAQAQAAKRRRVEAIALRYLQGKTPHILSAKLKGPFGSHWKNPWAEDTQELGIERDNDHPGEIELMPTAASSQEQQNANSSASPFPPISTGEDTRLVCQPISSFWLRRLPNTTRVIEDEKKSSRPDESPTRSALRQDASQSRLRQNLQLALPKALPPKQSITPKSVFLDDCEANKPTFMGRQGRSKLAALPASSSSKALVFHQLKNAIGAKEETPDSCLATDHDPCVRNSSSVRLDEQELVLKSCASKGELAGKGLRIGESAGSSAQILNEDTAKTSDSRPQEKQTDLSSHTSNRSAQAAIMLARTQFQEGSSSRAPRRADQSRSGCQQDVSRPDLIPSMTFVPLHRRPEKPSQFGDSSSITQDLLGAVPLLAAGTTQKNVMEPERSGMRLSLHLGGSGQSKMSNQSPVHSIDRTSPEVGIACTSLCGSIGEQSSLGSLFGPPILPRYEIDSF